MTTGSGEVSAELVWSARLLGQAVTKVGGVQDGVRNVQAQVSGSFRGIASNLEQLHPPIQEVQARLGSLVSQVETLARQADVDGEATPDEVVAALMPVESTRHSPAPTPRLTCWTGSPR